MNGAHDLGGMHGFGPIQPEPEATEPVFHAAWERRIFALALAAGALGQWNIDMSRYARERQHPVDYLRHSYYENWLAGLETLLVEHGLVTPEELAIGQAAGLATASLRQRLLPPERVPQTLALGSPVVMATPQPPRFTIGAPVRARNQHPTTHTREPRYVRGRVGVIAAHYGAHVFPDRNAVGAKEGQHLYSVRFEASELWGVAAPGRSAVYVDLWEAYLEPA
jgi:nitrile hydratase